MGFYFNSMNNTDENNLIPKIGLEIHLQLNTNSKLFCSCKNSSAEKPNTNICPICLGYPGSMPNLNQETVKKAVELGIALNSNINLTSSFDRKNYFYPDLPKGFQITQNRTPICQNGFLSYYNQDNLICKTGITQIHIEEDSGKMVHTNDESLIDFNRAGIPLLEIVTEPEFNSPEDALHFLKELKLTITYLGISDCEMHNGSLRVDANISLFDQLKNINYKKSEIKNLNSFWNVKDALDYEIIQQKDLLFQNKLPKNFTLLWDEKNKSTKTIRKKISKDEYRFIPEPDIPSLKISSEEISIIKENLYPLPENYRNILISKYKLSIKQANSLVSDKGLLEYFIKISKHTKNYVSVFNWLTGEISSKLKTKKISYSQLYKSAKNFIELIELANSKTISLLSAKEILTEVIIENLSPVKITRDKNLIQSSDKEEIKKLITEVINKNQDLVVKYKEGKKSLAGYFIGMVNKVSVQKINPKILREELIKILDS